MKIIKIDKISAEKGLPFEMKILFDEKINGKQKFTMGTAKIPSGARVPVEGENAHDGDEYAILLKGNVRIMSGGIQYHVKEGHASFIPAGEAHWSANEGDADCELVWVLTKP